MTDMDWADEIAGKVVSGCSHCKHCGNINRDDLMPGFSAALRKAKADGMLDAAEVVFQNRHYLTSHVLELIRAAASKLDPPTT